MIESVEKRTIIYTDHAATLGIIKQSSLNTVSTEKLNLCLIRASEYLQCFRLDVKHKPGRNHYIADVLSRLANGDGKRRQEQNEEGILDTLHATATES